MPMDCEALAVSVYEAQEALAEAQSAYGTIRLFEETALRRRIALGRS